MSKSTLKLKKFNIFNLNDYYKNLNDDILQEEEDIIDIIYEPSPDNKNIFCDLILLSKGTLLYFEYNTISKKISNFFTNTALSMITNELTCGELSFNSPIIVATSLNELIYVETTKKPCPMINATEDEIIIVSEPCDSKILKIHFNCNQNIICAICLNEIKIFKIGIDKTEEGKTILEYFNDIKIKGLNNLGIEFGLLYDKKFFFKFSNFIENNLIMSFITEKPTNNEIIRLSVDNDEISNNDKVQFLNILLINLSKKDTPIKLIQCFAVDMNFVKIKYTCFFEKLFVLFENSVVCCLNNDCLNNNDNTENNLNINNLQKTNSINNNISSNSNVNESIKKDFLFNEKIIFKYPFNSSNVKFMDIFVHPSSNFIVVEILKIGFLFLILL